MIPRDLVRDQEICEEELSKPEPLLIISSDQFRARLRSLFARLPPLSGIFFCVGENDRMGKWLILLLLCAGCTTKPTASQLNLTGFPPAFCDGYNDGCRSAHSSAPARDQSRFAGDTQYASGWRDGNQICRRQDE